MLFMFCWCNYHYSVACTNRCCIEIFLKHNHQWRNEVSEGTGVVCDGYHGDNYSQVVDVTHICFIIIAIRHVINPFRGRLLNLHNSSWHIICYFYTYVYSKHIAYVIVCVIVSLFSWVTSSYTHWRAPDRQLNWVRWEIDLIFVCNRTLLQ